MKSPSHLHLLAFTLLFTSAPPAMAEALSDAAAASICDSARENGKSRLGIFPLTDATGESTPDSDRATTRLMSGVLKCGLKIVDQGKMKVVLEQQAAGQTGLIDADTAPEIGQITGADSLLFGSADRTSIEFRLIDAATGEIIGAAVVDDSPHVVNAEVINSSKQPEGPVVQKIDAQRAQEQGDSLQMRQVLIRLKHKPLIYGYVVSTDAELQSWGKAHPAQGRLMRVALARQPAAEKRRIAKLRFRVLQQRAKDPDFDRMIQESRKGG